MLEVSNVSVGYGLTQVLWDVSLNVEEGEMVALVGSNGAGKTTLLTTISGLLRPLGGTIRFEGKEITRASVTEIVERGLIHVPEGRRLFPALSVHENLMLGAFRRRDARGIVADLTRVLALFPILEQRAGQLAGTLSGGEQQMCAIGRGLMAHPRLLMIDELSLGLAPLVIEQLHDVLGEIREAGTTLLVVEQDVGAALSQASRGYVMETGEVRLSGTATQLLNNDAVRRAYLGV